MADRRAGALVGGLDGDRHAAWATDVLNTDLLSSLIAALLPDTKARTGQVNLPRFLIVQINNYIQYSQFSAVAHDQWLAGQTLENAHIVCPSYFAPMELDHRAGENNGIHAIELGRFMIGECVALAYKALFIDRVAWSPLQPIRATREGTTVTLDFRLPPGGGPVAFDSWVPLLASDNYGFTYTDDSSSVVIRAVRLDGTKVILTLDAVPIGANERVIYAHGQSINARFNDASGWSACRGKLVSPTTQKSLFYRLGYRVPEFVNHYCVRFSMPVRA